MPLSYWNTREWWINKLKEAFERGKKEGLKELIKDLKIEIKKYEK